MLSVHAALIACRFAHDATATLLWGTFGYLLTCVPEGLADDAAIRLGRLTSAAVAIVAVTAVCALPLKTAMIGDGWKAAVSPEMLRAVVTETSVGTAWLADVVASLLLVLAGFMRPPRRNPAIAAASGLVLASLVLTGHAMMHEGWRGYVQQANDVVHVLASAAWLGALVPLTIVLRGLSTTNQDGDHDAALRRFSAAGRVAVVLILVTGAINTFLIIGGWPTHWTVPYQSLLSLKIVIVLAMIGLATRNHFVLGPRLEGDRSGVALAIRRAAFVEIVLGLTAIALVAVFGLMDPGGAG